MVIIHLRRRLVTWVGCIASLLVSGSAHAHHRDFTFMRDWYLPYAGEREIESRLSYVGKTREVFQETEFEIGISKHFAIEPGFAFHGMAGEKTHIDEYGMELRFNFGEFETNKVLYALNVGYENPVDSAEAKRGELQFIASVYTPKGEDISVNLNIGTELNLTKQKESEITFGYVRPLTPIDSVDEMHEMTGWRGGFESVFDFQEHNFYIGPTLVRRQSKHLNALISYLFAANHRSTSNDIAKLIFEWEF